MIGPRPDARGAGRDGAGADDPDPGHSGRVLLLPVAAACAWLFSLLLGAGDDWRAAGSVLASHSEWPCVAVIVFGGALPAAALAVMLRRGAAMRPRVTLALGALAAVGFANVVACVSEPHPRDLATLVWHWSTLAALVVLATVIAKSVLPWRRASLDG